MAHFAKINQQDIVETVIIAEQDFIDTLEDKDTWIQTSYNTIGGIHLNGGIPLRKNYACIGFKYDRQRDAFIPPKRYDSWHLNEDTCLWEAPVPMPAKDGYTYNWDEENMCWIEELIPPEESA